MLARKNNFVPFDIIRVTSSAIGNNSTRFNQVSDRMGSGSDPDLEWTRSDPKPTLLHPYWSAIHTASPFLLFASSPRRVAAWVLWKKSNASSSHFTQASHVCRDN